MYDQFIRHSLIGVFACSIIMVASSLVFSQARFPPEVGSLIRTKIKLIGFLNAKIEQDETRPVLTLGLPADEKRYTFLMTDMKILSGPLRTPGSILSEVKPFSTNFYLRASPETVAQISSATSTEQLAIIADYSSGDRVLLVDTVEKSEQEQEQEKGK
ncbi:MAG: hypothetical protein AB7P69_25280 [Candidatus Binatia bacterium]